MSHAVGGGGEGGVKTAWGAVAKVFQYRAHGRAIARLSSGMAGGEMNDHERLAPGLYVAPSTVARRNLRDWWLVRHPPYTLWQLSYVVSGGCLAPNVGDGRLAATVMAFFLAVGVGGAHALDELHGRPLRTAIPGWSLAGVGAACIVGDVGPGLVGVGLGLAACIVVGVVLAAGYNLELFGGRLHNDVTFAGGLGLRVLIAYYVQAGTLSPAGVAAAGRGVRLVVRPEPPNADARRDGTSPPSMGPSQCRAGA
jgi:hypothetical protein